MAANTVAITDATFVQEVLESPLPVLVDFWAPWCGPCRMVAPVLEEIAAEKAETLKIAKINIDENPGIAGQLGIQSIPTMVLFHGGKGVGKIVGFRPKADMVRILDQALSTLTTQ